MTRNTRILFYFALVASGLGKTSENERLYDPGVDGTRNSWGSERVPRNVSEEDPVTPNSEPKPTEQGETAGNNNSHDVIGVNPNPSEEDETTENNNSHDVIGVNLNPTEEDETAENDNSQFLGVFPDDVKEHLAIAKKKLLLAPLILLRPLAIKAANFFNHLTHPNVAWTPAHFFQKLRDKFENMAAFISQAAFGSGLYHNADYPFPYKNLKSKK